MKWLLQSPAGKNPSDDFIRLGVTNLVREVDPDAQVTIIDKMERGQWIEPIRFDKAVWCGGPTLFDRHDAHEKYIKILTEFKNA